MPKKRTNDCCYTVLSCSVMTVELMPVFDGTHGTSKRQLVAAQALPLASMLVPLSLDPRFNCLHAASGHAGNSITDMPGSQFGRCSAGFGLEFLFALEVTMSSVTPNLPLPRNLSTWFVNSASLMTVMLYMSQKRRCRNRPALLQCTEEQRDLGIRRSIRRSWRSAMADAGTNSSQWGHQKDGDGRRRAASGLALRSQRFRRRLHLRRRLWKVANQEALNTNRRNQEPTHACEHTHKGIMFQRLSRAIYINGFESNLLN